MKNTGVILAFWAVFLVVSPLHAQSVTRLRKYQEKEGRWVVYQTQADSWKDQ